MRLSLPCIALKTVLVLAGAMVATLATGNVHAQESLPYQEFPYRQLPAIPIFFGQSYEGRLSAENGYNEAFGYKGFKRVRIDKYHAAYFDIDLYEGEYLTYGLLTDSQTDLTLNVMYEVTDRKGNKNWKVEGADFFGHNAQYRCTNTIKAAESRRYRFEIITQMPEVVANYKLFILPKAEQLGLVGACDKKLSDQALAYFEAPGQPASLAIAQAWQDKPWLPTLAVPPIHAPAVTAEAEAYAQGKPEALRGFYRALHVDGEHNATLNFQRLGLAAMEAGEYAEAEWAFDQALERIEAIYGRSAVNADARSRWRKEGIKEFKGEPYERVMAYYYRGLLYLRAGDYQNARAAFTAGEFQDTLSEAEEFQGDFALMNYLAGWSSHCAGEPGLADEAFALAEQVNPAIRRPAGEDTLLIADLGRSPVKYGRGSASQMLTFVEAVDHGREEAVAVSMGDGEPRQVLPEYSNLYFQATTRGGRAFDAILDGKAGLRTGMVNTAEVGALMMSSGIMPVMVAGLVVSAITGKVGDKVKPDADVRMWDTLPHHVSMGLAANARGAPVDFTFTGTHAVAEGTPVMRAHAGKCGIAWARSRSALQAAPGAPGNDEEIVTARLKHAEAKQRDAAFRDALGAAGQAN